MTKKRLYELRAELEAERISYEELAEIEMAAVEHGVVITDDMLAGDILNELQRVL